MAKQIFTINTILPGWSPSEFFYLQGQFLSSIGIDPEMPRDDSSTKPSGLIRPTAMEKISADAITGVPVWMETNDKDANIYVYAKDGKVHTIASNLTMGTALNSGNAITGATGNGLAYYNNYLYIALDADVGRYGPLNGTPTLDIDWWTNILSLTALTDTTYPTIKGVEIPNHAMYVHPANNRLYFCDVDANNIGIVSMIKTTKVTVEGDTNDVTVPSAYKVLDFYYGWYPTCISSIGTEIAVGLIYGVNTTTKQKNAQVAFWSTLPSDTGYNRIADLPDPLITAMKNINGQLYVFSGSASGGMRISRYLGGQSFEEIYYADDQVPPLQGAVDYMLNRIVMGASTTTPAVSASVLAVGSKSKSLAMGVHNILKTTSAGTTPWVTCLKYVTQGATKQPLVGWTDGSGKGIDKLSTSYKTSIFRSQVYSIGRNGSVVNVRIPLAQAVAANQTIVVKIISDDGAVTTTLGTINSTIYTDSQRFINLTAPAFFKNNFLLEITFSGTALAVVSLPIQITVEYLNE